MLEFVEDVSLFELRAHASCSAYGIAASLAADMAAHLSAVCLFQTSSLHSPFAAQPPHVRELQQADRYVWITDYLAMLSYSQKQPLSEKLPRSKVWRVWLQAANGTGNAQKARLHFAHAETVAPFAALMGLHGSEGPCELGCSKVTCHS